MSDVVKSCCTHQVNRPTKPRGR